jgi:hypothetical protein
LDSLSCGVIERPCIAIGGSREAASLTALEAAFNSANSAPSAAILEFVRILGAASRPGRCV